MSHLFLGLKQRNENSVMVMMMMMMMTRINNPILLMSFVKYKHVTSTVERLQLNRRRRARGSLSFIVDKRRPLQRGGDLYPDYGCFVLKVRAVTMCKKTATKQKCRHPTTGEFWKQVIFSCRQLRHRLFRRVISDVSVIPLNEEKMKCFRRQIDRLVTESHLKHQQVEDSVRIT